MANPCSQIHQEILSTGHPCLFSRYKLENVPYNGKDPSAATVPQIFRQELLKKKNRVVKVQDWLPLQVKEQAAFKDISQFGRYLRARTYSLGSAIEIKNYFNYITFRRKTLNPKPSAERLPAEILADEFSKVREEYELFSTKLLGCLCSGSFHP
ncbi:MAG: hypothetical protein MZV63_51420 [Marinilabiliales bacterium]|nr:hypothetical protein [Marinilabiliales bacterium]